MTRFLFKALVGCTVAAHSVSGLQGKKKNKGTKGKNGIRKWLSRSKTQAEQQLSEIPEDLEFDDKDVVKLDTPKDLTVSGVLRKALADLDDDSSETVIVSRMDKQLSPNELSKRIGELDDDSMPNFNDDLTTPKKEGTLIMDAANDVVEVSTKSFPTSTNDYLSEMFNSVDSFGVGSYAVENENEIDGVDYNTAERDTIIADEIDEIADEYNGNYLSEMFNSVDSLRDFIGSSGSLSESLTENNIDSKQTLEEFLTKKLQEDYLRAEAVESENSDVDGKGTNKSEEVKVALQATISNYLNDLFDDEDELRNSIMGFNENEDDNNDDALSEILSLHSEPADLLLNDLLNDEEYDEASMKVTNEIIEAMFEIMNGGSEEEVVTFGDFNEKVPKQSYKSLYDILNQLDDDYLENREEVQRLVEENNFFDSDKENSYVEKENYLAVAKDLPESFEELKMPSKTEYVKTMLKDNEDVLMDKVLETFSEIWDASKQYKYGDVIDAERQKMDLEKIDQIFGGKNTWQYEFIKDVMEGPRNSYGDSVGSVIFNMCRKNDLLRKEFVKRNTMWSWLHNNLENGGWERSFLKRSVV